MDIPGRRPETMRRKADADVFLSKGGNLGAQQGRALGTVLFTRAKPPVGLVAHELRPRPGEIEIEKPNRVRTELVAEVDIVLNALSRILNHDALVSARADASNIQVEMCAAGIADAFRCIQNELGSEGGLYQHRIPLRDSGSRQNL